MKNQSVLLAKETEDGYVSMGTITFMPSDSDSTDRNRRENNMKTEQFIRFTTKDTDEWSEVRDVTSIARVYGKELSNETVNQVKDAIWDYMNETEGEWNDNGCLDAAQKQLEKEGYKVDWIDTDVEIFF